MNYQSLTFQQKVVASMWHLQKFWTENYGEDDFVIEQSNGDIWLRVGDWLEVRVHPKTRIDNADYYPIMNGVKLGVFDFDSMQTLAESRYMSDEDAIMMVNEDFWWDVDIEEVFKSLKKKGIIPPSQGEAATDDIMESNPHSLFTRPVPLGELNI